MLVKSLGVKKKQLSLQGTGVSIQYDSREVHLSHL